MPPLTSREAKEFIIDRIVTEAQREGVPLSETERRMLYFTETDWMPYDFAEVNEAFEREYDTPTYEAKIAAVIRSYLDQASPTDRSKWHDAVRVLSNEDHYVLVLIAQADRKKISLPFASAHLSQRLGPIGFGIFVGVPLILFACAVYWLYLRLRN